MGLVVGLPPKRAVWSTTPCGLVWMAKAEPMEESGVSGRRSAVRAPLTQALPPPARVAADWVPGARRVLLRTLDPSRAIRRSAW